MAVFSSCPLLVPNWSGTCQSPGPAPGVPSGSCGQKGYRGWRHEPELWLEGTNGVRLLVSNKQVSPSPAFPLTDSVTPVYLLHSMNNISPRVMLRKQNSEHLQGKQVPPLMYPSRRTPLCSSLKSFTQIKAHQIILVLQISLTPPSTTN